MAKKGLSLFLCLCMLFSVLSTIAYTNNSVILTGAALDDFLADSTSNDESSKNNTPDSTIGSTDFTATSEETSEAASEGTSDVVATNYAKDQSYTVSGSFLAGRGDDGVILTDGIIPDSEIAGSTVSFAGTGAVNTIIVDLGNQYTDINKIVVGGVAITSNRQYGTVAIEVSTDGVNYTTLIGYVETSETVGGVNNYTYDLASDVTAQYVKISIISAAYVLTVGDIQVYGSGNVSGDTSDDTTSSVVVPDDCYYYLDMEAPETAKPGDTIDVVFTIKNIKEELVAVEFFLDFDHTKVAPVITEPGKPMDALMTVYPTYTAEIDEQICELPAIEQICYYNSEDTQYELRFLDILDYPYIAGEDPTIYVNDGDLVVTVPFKVLNTVSNGDELTFSLIEGTAYGVTKVGFNDVHGTGDSATVVVAGGTGNTTPSGTCGENLTWTLDDKGTLTISGTGKMTDYSSYSIVPWSSYKYDTKYDIKSVIIQDGVTSIGNKAFYGSTSLTSVTIPNSVTTIGDCAFDTCESLTSVTIPNSVESIGDFAFYGCNSLSSVIIGNSVTTIGDCAFYWCESLTSVTIPDSVVSIGDKAFSDCTSLASVTIPDSVTTIGDDAFYGCRSLKSITIPDSVTSIEERAFSDCALLTEINVADKNAMYSSKNGVLFNKDKTTLICYPAGKSDPSYTIPNSVTTIGEWAFCGCESIASVTIPNSVTTIEYRSFSDCESLTSVTIPNSVKRIGALAFGYHDYVGSEYEKTENFTITGVKGSVAESYANNNGFTFIVLDITKLPENDFYMDEDASTMPNIAEGTKAIDIISTLAEYGITATVTDKNGNAIADDAVVGTGCVVKVSKDKEYVIIVWGDTDGDGNIDITDYLKVKSTMYSINSLTGVYFNAADADDDGYITVTDYLKLKAYLLN